MDRFMQLISYKPWKHTLVYRIDDRVNEIKLEIKKPISLEFKEVRKCIGYFDGKQWHKCPYDADVSKGYQCEYCKNKDIKKLHTVLDKKGFEDIFEKIRYKDYSIYFALFGDKVKCGVTSTRRFKDRLIEQGAGYFVEIARINDMEIAYAVEEYLKQMLGLADAIKSRDKLNGNDKISVLIQKLDELREIDLSQFSITLPEKFKVYKNPIKTFPDAKESMDRIDGRIEGFRANIIFFSNNDEIYYNIITYNIGKFFTLNRIQV